MPLCPIKYTPKEGRPMPLPDSTEPTLRTRIIGLTGYAQSGKDTVGQILVSQGFKRLAFADGVREAALALNPIVRVVPVYEYEDDGNMCWGFGAERKIKNIIAQEFRLDELVEVYGWEVAKTSIPEVRGLLQRMGTEVGRDLFGENVWVDRVAAQIEPGGSYVITDVRFPNEANWLKSVGGLLIRVTRPGVEAVNTHVSDAGVGALVAQGTINNDGTIEELEAVVKEAISMF